MRRWTGKRVEGEILSHRFLNSPWNQEKGEVAAASFPYLARPEACDGCRECVVQCPVSALELVHGSAAA
jgi:NAD-dependent dihydropyrimidine dehydrogenase PreA subunit